MLMILLFVMASPFFGDSTGFVITGSYGAGDSSWFTGYLHQDYPITRFSWFEHPMFHQTVEMAAATNENKGLFYGRSGAWGLVAGVGLNAQGDSSSSDMLDQAEIGVSRFFETWAIGFGLRYSDFSYKQNTQLGWSNPTSDTKTLLGCVALDMGSVSTEISAGYGQPVDGAIVIPMGISVITRGQNMTTRLGAWAIGNASTYRSLGLFGLSGQQSVGNLGIFWDAEYRVSLGGDSVVHGLALDATAGAHLSRFSGFCHVVSSLSAAKDTTVFGLGLEPVLALRLGPVFPLIQPRLFYINDTSGLRYGGLVGVAGLPVERGFGLSLEAGLLSVKGPWVAQIKMEKTLWR